MVPKLDSFSTILNSNIPPPATIEAIERSPSPLTAADLAALTGNSLQQSNADLVSLSSLSAATLSVSKDGDIIYKFPDNLKSAISASSTRAQLHDLSRKVKGPLTYVAKVSFGVVLLASLAAIFTTIFAISSSSSSDDDRRDNRRRRNQPSFGGNMMFSNFWGPSPFDFFFYRPYRPYYVYGRPLRAELGFLESVFSYIFGDGDPNNNIEEVRVRAAAAMIKANGFAVTAEQLAPFSSPPDSLDLTDSQAILSESFVLPIVKALGGIPAATADGDIVYSFPELKKTGLSDDNLAKLMGVSPCTSEYAEAQDLRAYADLPTDIVEEVPIPFSGASDLNKGLAGALGAVNLFGALYLGNLLSSPELAGVVLPAGFGVVQALLPFLTVYAVLYNVIPAVRFFRLKGENAEIEKRNRVRKSWKDALEFGGEKIKRKLGAAKKMQSSVERIGNDIVYNTGDNSGEDERRAQAELDAFDTKIN